MASLFETIENNAKELRLSLPSSKVAEIMEHYTDQDECLKAVDEVFQVLRDQKYEELVDMYMKTSRLPRKSPRTFDNFDFTRLHGKDVEQIRNLQSLSTLYAHQNVILIGPPGTGKTHLAEAIGVKCIENRMKAYFLTFSELNQRLTEARRLDKIGSTINGLVRPACLIIDEVGQSVFDVENTRLFFDVVNRRYNNDGNGSMIFTSNVDPKQWPQFFSEDSSLLCSMDRIFDKAIVCNVKGESYRGKGLVQLAVEAGEATNIK